jgi:hypothetical protein
MFTVSTVVSTRVVPSARDDHHAASGPTLARPNLTVDISPADICDGLGVEPNISVVQRRTRLSFEVGCAPTYGRISADAFPWNECLFCGLMTSLMVVTKFGFGRPSMRTTSRQPTGKTASNPHQSATRGARLGTSIVA